MYITNVFRHDLSFALFKKMAILIELYNVFVSLYFSTNNSNLHKDNFVYRNCCCTQNSSSNVTHLQFMVEVIGLYHCLIRVIQQDAKKLVLHMDDVNNIIENK